MQYFLLSLHALISLLLIVVVLLQQSKGGGLAGSFGAAGASEAFFGARGVMTILHKATIFLGTAFMISSLVLVVTSSTSSRGGSSLSQQAGQRAPVQSPTALPVTGADGSIPGSSGLATPIPADDAQAGDPASSDANTPDEGSAPDESGGDAGNDESGNDTP
jgi:preprotein translocase subunit SecG